MDVPAPPLWRRLGSVAAATVVGDLILGMASFSAISLAGLWYFSYEWIRLVALYASAGRTFGSAWQWELASAGSIVALPLLGFVIYLAFQAFRLPGQVYRAGRDGTFGLHARRWTAAERHGALLGKH
jgi:hypothetical protein